MATENVGGALIEQECFNLEERYLERHGELAAITNLREFSWKEKLAILRRVDRENRLVDPEKDYPKLDPETYY